MKVNNSGLAPVRQHAEPDGPAWAGPAVAGFDPTRPNIARIYDFLLGGKDHFPADRLEAGRLLGIYPHLARRIRENRLFLRRAVHWLAAERGISQFLDIGSGLPAAANTHEIAQAASPGCRIAYVDNDPMVVVHARALLASGPGVTAVQADAADPAAIMADADITALITPARPCAVILAMMLHFFDLGTARRIIAGFAARTAPGSYLVISVGSGDKRTGGALADGYRAHRLYNHSQDAIATLFAGLEIVDPPGLADARHWQPGTPAPVPSRSGGHILAAVARTPTDSHLTPLPPGSAKAGHQLAKADPASAASDQQEGSSSMHVPLPRWLVAASAAAMLMPVAGCGSPAPALASGPGPEKPHLIVAAVRATDEVPLYLAQQDGFFRQQGLDVTVVPLNTSTAAIPRLVNGSIDVIAGANYVSFFGAQAKGVLHIKVIAPAASCTASDFAVLTLPGSPITRPADLAGKTISEPGAASVNTLLIDAQLADHGAGRARARFVPIPFVSAAAALHAHRVDAISLIEPFLTEALAGGAQTLMQLCTGPTAGLPLSGDITTAAWAARYPRTAAAFARALAQGAAVAAGNHAADERVLAANVPITPPSLVSMVNFNAYPLTLNPVAIQQVADLMYSDRLLKTPLKVTPLLLRSTR